MCRTNLHAEIENEMFVWVRSSGGALLAVLARLECWFLAHAALQSCGHEPIPPGEGRVRVGGQKDLRLLLLNPGPHAPQAL